MRRSFLILALAVPAPAFGQAVDFNRDVRPILSNNCFACHGPDDKARKADLRLDRRDDALAVIDLKKPAESELARRITSADKADRMPPKKFGKPLTPAQVATLKAW